MGKAENEVEQYLCTKVRNFGGIPYKFNSPARNNVPDRLCVFPYGVVVFVECKAPNGSLSPGQIHELNRLHLRGHYAIVVSTKLEVDGIMMAIKEVLDGRVRSNTDAGSNILSQSEETDSKESRDTQTPEDASVCL